jgi:hypothetical protein
VSAGRTGGSACGAKRINPDTTECANATADRDGLIFDVIDCATATADREASISDAIDRANAP